MPISKLANAVMRKSKDDIVNVDMGEGIRISNGIIRDNRGEHSKSVLNTGLKGAGAGSALGYVLGSLGRGSWAPPSFRATATAAGALGGGAIGAAYGSSSFIRDKGLDTDRDDLIMGGGKARRELYDKYIASRYSNR